MRLFRVENGAIVEGPVIVSKPSDQPKVRLSGLELHSKSPDQLSTMGWLHQEIVGFEPFSQKTQIRTGPVNTVLADKVVSTYTVRDKTAQEMADDKEAAAILNLVTVQNKTIRDALWELNQAIRGTAILPTETRAQYTSRLKEMWKANDS